jgi:S-adenosylmethionine hydrolase
MQNKPVVAILTDFGPDSFYVGVMKAAVCSVAPDVPIVDLSHAVLPHAIDQGSFVLDTVCDFYPPGTVFLAVVDPGVGGDRRNLVVETGGLLFVGPDNGLFTEVVSRRGPVSVYEIDENEIDPFRMAPPAGSTFLGRDVFAPAAAALARGKLPREIGVESSQDLKTVPVPEVDIQPGHVCGVARHVDSFGNILFAITRVHLNRAFGLYDPSELLARVAGRDLGAVASYYTDCPRGVPAALINSWGRLEIAVPYGSAMDHFAQPELSGFPVEIRSKQ